MNYSDIFETLQSLSARTIFHDDGKLAPLMKVCRMILEEEECRPVNSAGGPGGLELLPTGEYTMIIPDLHARRGFFLDAMQMTRKDVSAIIGRILPDEDRTVLSDIINGNAVVVCVGDLFHSEGRCRGRWEAAFTEYQNDYLSHKQMDCEMNENLRLLEMIVRVKIAAGDNFVFLKGNHENITNERSGGNHAFGKFVLEGAMVSRWMERFASRELYDEIYRWEKRLPLMARGDDFLVSHCEPGRAFNADEIIDAYLDPSTIYDLTWIDNDQAEEGSVAATIEAVLGRNERQFRYFGGHRPVLGTHSLRQDGKFVQINTPQDHVVALFSDMMNFDPEKNIVSILRPESVDPSGCTGME